MTWKEIEFLKESNLIENVGEEGLEDSISAWKYAKSLKKITKKNILEIHRLLLRNLNPRIAGKFRKCNVSVGGRICPNWEKVEVEISEEIRALNHPKSNNLFTKDEVAKTNHILFERLHPFEDGNGRTGRILYNWQRLFLDLDIHIIKYNDRWDYYRWF